MSSEGLREAGPADTRSNLRKWVKALPHLWVYVAGGIAVAAVVVWCLRNIALMVLGLVGRLLLEMLDYIIKFFQNS